MHHRRRSGPLRRDAQAAIFRQPFVYSALIIQKQVQFSSSDNRPQRSREGAELYTMNVSLLCSSGFYLAVNSPSFPRGQAALILRSVRWYDYHCCIELGSAMLGVFCRRPTMGEHGKSDAFLCVQTLSSSGRQRSTCARRPGDRQQRYGPGADANWQCCHSQCSLRTSPCIAADSRYHCRALPHCITSNRACFVAKPS